MPMPTSQLISAASRACSRHIQNRPTNNSNGASDSTRRRALKAPTPPEALCKVSSPLLSTVSGTASSNSQASRPNCRVTSSSVPNSRSRVTQIKVSAPAIRQPNTSTWLSSTPMGRCLAAW
ncbi:hypothetical protein D3C81_1739380 [compost metagenome]